MSTTHQYTEHSRWPQPIIACPGSDSPRGDIIPVAVQAPLLDHVQQRHRVLRRGGWGYTRGALNVHGCLQQAAINHSSSTNSTTTAWQKRGSQSEGKAVGKAARWNGNVGPDHDGPIVQHTG